MTLPKWRLAAAGAAFGGLLASTLAPVAHAAGTCGVTPAHEAFDVQGLKSELMVTALSCSQQDRYNAFVAKFRAHLMDEEARLNAYFRTTYGKSAQREHDDYITQLANVQSEKSLNSGTAFCNQRVAMFDEVQVLDNASDLSAYAEAKDITQPASYETCGAPVTTPTRATSARRSTRKVRS
ncbi:hypothetical protein AA103196_0178 [Ameyamaea chiangmaiensis NBRC 103196]|uniref:Uncharacterized protein n=1 Tax=Ameyamaea chiangmaiensis TaxID=442969 RepID=A0A850P9R5_9PROT|nr:hypothetical protein [Ameyamaea chiangmaiensis]MBS4076452.1 hypothetical protein [Ameyamaea chiangmaiensis]NVN41335.1 hypothetical protein [Ameyamaea chiangmaiensis]GBQ61940.1 hypothetical protein AA103196_0178 [Ameyamaea chiangmaiensis NBRC 103196]